MKKIISLLMVLCIMASLCTVSAYADSDVASLQAAIDAAPGTELTLASTITVNDIVTLDLKGCVVRFTTNTAGDPMIRNNGGLTITDTVGGGKLSFEFVGIPAGYTGDVGSCTIVNRGSLVVSGGTVENTTNKSGHFSAVIDNNSTVSNASVVINGGSVIGTASAYGVRLYSNSSSCSNSVTVSSGEVSGSRGVNLQVTASGAPTSASISGGYVSGSYAVVTIGDVSVLNNTSISISGGTIDGIVDIGSKQTQISGGTFSGGYIYHRDAAAKGFISGGTFSKDSVVYFNDYIADGFEQTANGNDGYTVAPPKYDMQGAVDSATGNSSKPTVQLPAEQVVVEEPIKIAENTTLEIIPSASVPVVEMFALASGCDSIFELGKNATVKIVGEYSEAEIKQVRELLKKEYCVRKGSIIIDDAHNLGSDGKCKDCAVQVVSNPYAVPSTADNSNMPLWTILFVGFAAVALLTGKKKKA